MIFKKLFPPIMLMLAFLILAVGDGWTLYPAQSRPQSGRPYPGRLIVKFQNVSIPGTAKIAQGILKTGQPQLDLLNEKYRVSALRPFSMRTRKQAAPATGFENIYVLQVDPNADLSTMAQEYQEAAGVVYAEPDYLAEFYETPNDPLYSHQWNLNNNGQVHYAVKVLEGAENDSLVLIQGVADADIDVGEVLDTPPDNTVAAVAGIMDTGVDIDHPDLAANIWTNPREIPGNGLDDDNNGYIDDIHGWDFSGDGSIGSPGDNDPTDTDGHGTHCAGLVAAVANNSIGITGVAPGCRLMPLKILPWPLTTVIADALIYAADNGVDAINMSFGLPFRSHLMEDAAEYARSKGVILCAAIGNDFVEKVNFPAGFPSCFAVGATDDSDFVTPFSTYGDHLKVVAPGVSILSLRAAQTDMYASSYPREPRVHIVDSLYYLASGTSMACPQVVGIATYIRSVSPGLIPSQVEEIITQTAEDLVDPYGVGWNLPGFDKYSGYGRASLSRALQVVPVRRAQIDSPKPNAVLSGMVAVSGLADGADFGKYVVEYGSGGNPVTWWPIDSSLTPVSGGLLTQWDTDGLSGRYTIRLRVDETNVAYSSVYIANDTLAELVAPLVGDTIDNFVDIKGSGYCPDFSHLLVEFGSLSLPGEWDTIQVRTIPAYNDVLAGWFIEGLSEGEYFLRLTVHAHGGPVATDTTALYVKSIFSGDKAWKVKLGADPTIVPTFADLDLDGVNEIIVGTSTGVKYFKPDGTPTALGLPAFPPNNYAVPLAVGKLDEDDIEDVVALGYMPPMIYGYPSGIPSFRNYLGILPGISTNLMTEHELPKIFLKDINSDGRDEIHVTINDYTLSKSFLINSDGTIRFSLNHSSSYLPVDLNGDALDELYVCNDRNGLLRQINVLDGTVADSLLLQNDGATFYCQGLSAFDIDDDGRPELIVFGYYNGIGYYLYAFDEGLELMPGWPHEMKIGDFVVPTAPIFGDIDRDGNLEYFCTYFDFSTSFVMAWNLDGTPYLAGSSSGLFATVPQPSVLNMLMIADMNGDQKSDLVGIAINDIFFTYEVQRIYGWDKNGKMLPDYPLITQMGASTYLRYSPVVGDINRDGKIDLLLTTPDSALVFVNYPAVEYDSCLATAPFWRYSRRMNNVGRRSDSCYSTSVHDDHPPLPDRFVLYQNAPNPFNSSTRIEYALSAKSVVDVSIFDILGRKVRDLFNRVESPGRHTLIWDGTDNDGVALPSGLYFYRVRAGENMQARKMVLIK